MKERPILFNAPMVRAILAGTKTQTRRVAPIASLDIRHHDRGMVTWCVKFSKPVKGAISSYLGGKLTEDQARNVICSMCCPYGAPGDRLWVRETWARDDEDGRVMYRADIGHDYDADAWEEGRVLGLSRYRWRPSIHMPRAVSRITLEITAVRVERLQDISEGDAWAEGVTPNQSEEWFDNWGAVLFRRLWESINGADSWESNPWVWVLEFRRV